MRKRKTVFDDGFQAYLTEGARFVGDAGIPVLMDLKNTQIPFDIIPFTKARACANKRQYIHFYEHDKAFSTVLTSTKQYLDLLKQFDGVITPDCTMMIGQSKCLQEANTYMNRAVGYFLQRQGLSVIANLRWSDESSFEYCFLGVPKNDIVAVSTHGCITSKEQRLMFKKGMSAMLETLTPKAVLVHGYMPDDIFGEFKGQAEFYRYASQFERTHRKEGA
ncbi:MAG: DUF4417 domain-containing protein [Clostridiales bacterium]|nr:DUF4417 domain-containing protein [Clostridiales bacterium]